MSVICPCFIFCKYHDLRMSPVAVIVALYQESKVCLSYSLFLTVCVCILIFVVVEWSYCFLAVMHEPFLHRYC